MAEFRRTHNHQKGKTGQTTGMYLPDDIKEVLDKHPDRGRRSRSAFAVELIERALAREAAVSLDFLPPVLKEGATCQHAHSRIVSTGRIQLDGSIVTPARGPEGARPPYSVHHHYIELSPSSKILPGHHHFSPDRCRGCVQVAADFPRGV